VSKEFKLNPSNDDSTLNNYLWSKKKKKKVSAVKKTHNADLTFIAMWQLSLQYANGMKL
jgi:hypothetical protein